MENDDREFMMKVGEISFLDFNSKVVEVMHYDSEKDYVHALKDVIDSNYGGFKYETLKIHQNS